MSVNGVVNVVLLSLAGLSLLAGVAFILKGLGARSRITRQAYSVGQVEAKRISQVHWIRAGFFFLAGLLFLGIFAIRPLFSRVGEAAPLPTPTISVPTQAPTATLPVVLATNPPAPTSAPVTPTAEATAAPTATSAPVTAAVSSGVGVWLRGAPSTSGEQVEWLLDGTIVTVLAGQETADDLLWQQVRTETGIEGWVASDFLTLNQPAP